VVFGRTRRRRWRLSYGTGGRRCFLFFFFFFFFFWFFFANNWRSCRCCAPRLLAPDYHVLTLHRRRFPVLSWRTRVPGWRANLPPGQPGSYAVMQQVIAHMPRRIRIPTGIRRAGIQPGSGECGRHQVDHAPKAKLKFHRGRTISPPAACLHPSEPGWTSVCREHRPWG